MNAILGEPTTGGFIHGLDYRRRKRQEGYRASGRTISLGIGPESLEDYGNFPQPEQREVIRTGLRRFSNETPRAVIHARSISFFDIESLLERYRSDPVRALSALNKQAQTNKPFGNEEVAVLHEEACAAGNNPQPDFLWEQVRNPDNHGRVRWLLLELLARNWNGRLPPLLVELLENEKDPWVLMGTAIVIRFTKMTDYRNRVSCAFREILQAAKQDESFFGPALRASVLGEVLNSAGSFAEPEDIELLGWFALRDPEQKPRINACDALARTLRRHLRSRETNGFFEDHGERLRMLAIGWANSWRSSNDIGALLFAWIGLIMARLGPEGKLAVELCDEAPELAPRILSELKRSQKTLNRRGENAWLEERAGEIESWRRSLTGSMTTTA